MLLGSMSKAELHLGGCIHMQVVIVGDELYGGVPDVLGGELASPLNEGDHNVCVPLQIREEPANRLIAAGLSSDNCFDAEQCDPRSSCLNGGNKTSGQRALQDVCT